MDIQMIDPRDPRPWADVISWKECDQRIIGNIINPDHVRRWQAWLEREELEKENAALRKENQQLRRANRLQEKQIEALQAGLEIE